MNLEIRIRHWISHLNQLLYSALIFCKRRNVSLSINHFETAPFTGAIMIYNGVSFLLDYSNDPKLLKNHQKFHFYFKRSLKHIFI